MSQTIETAVDEAIAEMQEWFGGSSWMDYGISDDAAPDMKRIILKFVSPQLAAVREESAKLREAAELVLQHALPCEDLRHRLPQRVAFEMLRAAISPSQEPQT